MSNTPFITITELCNEVVDRDREAQADINEARNAQETAMQNLIEDYEIVVQEQRDEMGKMNDEINRLDAKLVDLHEDNHFLDSEVFDMNEEIKYASEAMENMMADYEVIGFSDPSTFEEWADKAYAMMRRITNEFPIIHNATDFYAAYEDAYADARDMDVDWDDSYYVEDYHDDRWQEAWNENAVEYFDTQEA